MLNAAVYLGLVMVLGLTACAGSSADGLNTAPDGGAGGQGGDGSGPGTDAGTVASPDASAGADGRLDGASAAAGDAKDPTAVTAEQVRTWAEAYKAAHPGNGGKDWDIIACCGGASRTEASLAADSDAQRLRALCGKDQLPVIPMLAWEYGGGDHPWIKAQASALVYCVYIPLKSSSPNWSYDRARDRITADVYVKFPDQNPCKNEQGADQVLKCLGDMTNIDILVDTASLHDGADVGLRLANASTDLFFILPGGTKVHLYLGL